MQLLTTLLLTLCAIDTLAIWWLIEAVFYLLDRDDETGDKQMILKRQMELLSRPGGCWSEKKIIPIKGSVFEDIQEVRCSECKSYFRTIIVHSYIHYDYCPNCGARMRGDSE